MSRLNEAFNKLKEKAKSLKNEVMALYLAYKRPDVPWYAKLLSILVVGYALSPVDLIPDFIPVVGYLDDLVLVPLGVALVVRMIPPKVMEECREQARDAFSSGKPVNWISGIIIILVWITILGFIIYKIFM